MKVRSAVTVVLSLWLTLVSQYVEFAGANYDDDEGLDGGDGDVKMPDPNAQKSQSTTSQISRSTCPRKEQALTGRIDEAPRM